MLQKKFMPKQEWQNSIFYVILLGVIWEQKHSKSLEYLIFYLSLSLSFLNYQNSIIYNKVHLEFKDPLLQIHFRLLSSSNIHFPFLFQFTKTIKVTDNSISFFRKSAKSLLICCVKVNDIIYCYCFYAFKL